MGSGLNRLAAACLVAAIWSTVGSPLAAQGKWISTGSAQAFSALAEFRRDSSDSVGSRPTVHLTDDHAGERHKSPVLAWFLSWLVPGGGQGYNGQWVKAAAFFTPAVVGLALAQSNGGWECTADCGTRDLGLALMVGASIGSQIDAPIAASHINKRARVGATAGPQINVTLARIGF